MVYRPSPEADPSIAESAEVSQIATRWETAWNAHDVAAMTDLVASGVDFVNVTGRWLQGAAEFREWHDSIHRLHLRTSIWITNAVHVRSIQPGLVLAHIEWTIAGERSPDNTPRPDRSGIFTWLLSRLGAQWEIIAAHNTNLGDGVESHRAHAFKPAERGTQP